MTRQHACYSAILVPFIYGSARLQRPWQYVLVCFVGILKFVACIYVTTCCMYVCMHTSPQLLKHVRIMHIQYLIVRTHDSNALYLVPKSRSAGKICSNKSAYSE